MLETGVVNLVNQNRTAYLGRDLRQLTGAGGVASYFAGPRESRFTWDDTGLARWRICGRRRARPWQDPSDSAMA